MKRKYPRPTPCIGSPDAEIAALSAPEVSKPLGHFDIERMRLRDRAYALTTRFQHTIGYGIVRTCALPYPPESAEATDASTYVVVFAQLSGAIDWNVYFEFYTTPDDTSIETSLETVDKATVDVVKSREVKVLACLEAALGEEQKAQMLREMSDATLILETLDVLYPEKGTHH